VIERSISSGRVAGVLRDDRDLRVGHVRERLDRRVEIGAYAECDTIAMAPIAATRRCTQVSISLSSIY
jgi:hypothetical protein